MSENAGLGQKMLFVDGHYLTPCISKPSNVFTFDRDYSSVISGSRHLPRWGGPQVIER